MLLDLYLIGSDSALLFQYILLVVCNYGASACRVTASIQLKGLILAQNERWRRGLGMQVEREVLKRYFG